MIATLSQSEQTEWSDTLFWKNGCKKKLIKCERKSVSNFGSMKNLLSSHDKKKERWNHNSIWMHSKKNYMKIDIIGIEFDFDDLLASIYAKTNNQRWL